MDTTESIENLKKLLATISPTSTDASSVVGAQIRAAKEAVIARFAPMFAPENLPALTAEKFQDFLLFKNNQHWDSLHRQGPNITKDMGRLRKAIEILLDEGQPIRKRLNRLRLSDGDEMVRGLGRAVLTAILQVVYPSKYGVLNNTAEAGMKNTGLWPDIRRGSSFGDRYEAVNRVLLETAEKVGTDLWTLDMLWWRCSRPESVVPVVPPPSSDVAFALEVHLHDFMIDNWDAIELGREWALLEEDGEVVGSEYNTGEVGAIDILARHRRDKSWLVVELKRSQTSDETVGQLLRYMGWVRRKLVAKGEKVHGLIVCSEVDAKLRYAMADQPSITCMTYKVNFHLECVIDLDS